MEVDRVALALELGSLRHLLLGRGGPEVRHQPGIDPFEVVLGPRALGTLLVVGDKMLQLGAGALPVEGEALVGDRVEEDAAGPQLGEVGLERADRILAVLEEVVGDDEVDRALADRLSVSPSSITSTSTRSCPTSSA